MIIAVTWPALGAGEVYKVGVRDRAVRDCPRCPHTQAMMRVALTLAALGASVRAQSTEAPTLTVSTVVASPSAATSAPIASQSVSPPVPQAWCPSEIFCAGEVSGCACPDRPTCTDTLGAQSYCKL